MSASLLKFAAVAWTGGATLIMLLIHGKQMYGWIWGKFCSERDKIAENLDIMFIEISLQKLTRMYVAYIVCLFCLAMFLLYPSLAAGAVFGIVWVLMLWKMPLQMVNLLFKMRVTRFVHQMVDGLSLISNALRSGLNVNQGLSIVVEEMPNPIAQEFNLVLSQNKLGVTLEDALTNLSKRMPNDDIEMFTTSINILKETGGNLAETFDTIAYTIRERIKIESKISAMVSQGVMQGIIVVLMPFALGAMLYAIEPERIEPMFTTIPGWLMLSFMVTLQIIGAWAIWKIVQVKV